MQGRGMKAILLMCYSLFCYVAGLGVLTVFVLWVAPWPLLPWHIDQGGSVPLLQGVMVDTGLLLLFGVQHSVMARPVFKRLLTRWIPAPVERSSYVLWSALAIGLICAFWQPLDGMAWEVQAPVLRWLLIGGYVAGWGMAVWATFTIDHFELFGLHQAWRHVRGQPEPAPVFFEVSLYRYVRHPMQLGVLIGLWSTPAMSMAHLALAIGMGVYVLVGLYFEERDLVRELGPAYADYRQRVRQLIPSLTRPQKRS